MTTPRRPYRTDLSDARWALIEPTMTAWRAAQGGLGIRPPVHDLREIVNAILYVNRTGIAWEYLPHDFPPYKTVHSYFTRWAADGTPEKIHNLLRGKVRQASGRDTEPTAAIIDAQSVKTSNNVPEASQGIDAGKKIKGRKRHLATDVLGLLLVVIVTAASISDTAAGRDVIDRLATTHHDINKVWVDSAYRATVIERGTIHGIDVEVVTKTPGQKGFQPLPKRWAIERTNGWIMLHRRLARDYETSPEHSRAHIHWAMIDNMSRRLTHESTPSWRDHQPETGTPSQT